jgi:intracellular sulfur oxidation DsrE/DsrF family protein
MGKACHMPSPCQNTGSIARLDEKMNQLLFIGLVTFALMLGAAPGHAQEPGEGKYLVILQAGKKNPEGMARALHALLYSDELMKHGHEVVLVFDGAGTEWVHEWSDPETKNKYASKYLELKKKGVTELICDYCAGAFQVKKDLLGRKLTLDGEFEGHPSIAKWADQGYQLVVL